MALHHTGVARSLAGRDLAREVARMRLGATRTDRTAGTLADAVTVGMAVGLSVSEMRRVGGCSRQTIYNALREPVRAATPPDAQLGLEVLVVLVGAGGALPVAELARHLRVEPDWLLAALRGLEAQGLCRLDGLAQSASAIASATEDAAELLREHLDDLLVTRADSIAVYLHVDPGEIDAIDRSAHAIVSHHEYVLMRASVAPSVMSGPELALAVRVPTVRRALAIAADLWDEIRAHADLEPRAPRFATVIPPTAQPDAASPVLDVFLDALAEVAPDSITDADHARRRYHGGVDERRLAGRCLTAAARAMRRSLSQDRDPRPVEDGEAAFYEYEAVAPLRLDASGERIQKPLIAALERGIERLGPFPGGRLGSFRGPAGPNIVDEVHPTPEDLAFIAHHAGLAVGYAAAAGHVDAAVEMLRVVTGR